MESPTNRSREAGHWAEREAMHHLLHEFLYFSEYRRGLSQTTIHTYRYILEGFITYLAGRELTLEAIDDYAKYLSAKEYAPKTFRSKLSAIKSFVTYLYINDLTTIKPESIIIPKDRPIEANFLDYTEARQLLKAVCLPRDRAMIMVLLSSGVRCSELINLRYEDLFKRSIIVRDGKGHKPRVVFITPETEEAIETYLLIRGKEPGYLFPNPHGERLSRQLVSRKVAFYAAKAGIHKKVCTHTLRHTMATTMLRNGARVEDVQQILGHSNIRNTMLYLHFTNDLLQKSYNHTMTKQRSLTKIN